jgi:hypothetical protein
VLPVIRNSTTFGANIFERRLPNARVLPDPTQTLVSMIADSILMDVIISGLESGRRNYPFKHPCQVVSVP